jgi:hypothetical protein
MAQAHAQAQGVPLVEGWCDRRGANHEGQYLHRRRQDCEGFVSDEEHTAEMLRQAREHDARSDTAGYPEAAYVAEYRPY